jgi:hypothetical protein
LRSPHCSQCQTLSLPCRYTEGGKRGIPAAYINSLEDRLAETEAALYSALTAIDSMSNDPAGLRRALVHVSGPVARERSKIEKQNEWKRLPLRSGEQLHAWLEDKSSDCHVPHISSSLDGHPPSTQGEAFAGNDATADAVEAPGDLASTDNATTSHTPSNVQIPAQFQDPAQWRNYF